MSIASRIVNEADTDAVVITRIDAWACRHPIDQPVTTSFGTMRDRAAVFVRIEDKEGCFGWGEIFANWPAAGAEHRVNLLMQDIAELVVNTSIRNPPDLSHQLEDATAIPALQCGEPGPFRQVIAGLDIAVWDLFARRSAQPLRKFIDPQAPDFVRAYASGIGIGDTGGLIDKARANGFHTFKAKVGFNLDADIEDLVHLGSRLAPHERLSADANQAWDVKTAKIFLERTESLDLEWLEEPIRADAPDGDWQTLARHSATALAGGENIAGFDAFAHAIGVGGLTVFQPDIAKWGGVSGCLKVGRAALDAGKHYCPHYLGGGIGLSASAELLAAVGGNGMLEVDVNENPLRDAFRSSANAVSRGCWHFGDQVGLGIRFLPIEVENCVTLHRTWAR